MSMTAKTERDEAFDIDALDDLDDLDGLEDREGMDAAHAPGICHNPLCVNPRHLREATRAENVADMQVDGTSYRGERNHMSKLAEADVRAIRADTRPQRTIATQYGLTPSQVSRIKGRKTWAWLE